MNLLWEGKGLKYPRYFKKGNTKLNYVRVSTKLKKDSNTVDGKNVVGKVDPPTKVSSYVPQWKFVFNKGGDIPHLVNIPHQ